MVLGQKCRLLASRALELHAVNYLCKILGEAPILSLGSEVGEEEGCCTPSSLPGRRRWHSHGHRLCLITPAGSPWWVMPSPLPHAGGDSACGAPAAEGPLLPRASCTSPPSALARGSQAFLYLPFLPSFRLLPSFVLFMSLVKSRFIHFRATVFSLSQPSFISEPLPSCFCLT